MNYKVIIISSIAVIFITARGWNDFAWRYSGAGHIPSIPLYFKTPVQKEQTQTCCLTRPVQNEQVQTYVRPPAQNKQAQAPVRQPVQNEQAQAYLRQLAEILILLIILLVLYYAITLKNHLRYNA